jgi:molecular chaperone GrpE (heat shock protein)
MTEPRTARKPPPKPRLPSRAKGALKDSSRKTKGGTEQPAKRTTTADIAARIDHVAEALERIERHLAPSRGEDITAQEKALLDIVDRIVERRTESALVPVARLATLVERLATAPTDERVELARDTVDQLSLVLEALAIERVSPSRGDELDPFLHQEVEERHGTDLDEGLVVSVVRPGFRIRGGRLLIPALVAVAGGTRE